MPWFKVDDKLHDHRKARAAGKAAMGVWVMAGSWSADNLMDGFLPRSILNRWGTAADAKRLVSAGLWTESTQDGETGWRFHEWDERQPSREFVLAERESARIRMAEVRANRRKNIKRSSGEVRANFGRTSEEVQEVFAHPDPTRPDHEGSKEPSGTQKRATQLPDDWKPTDKDREYAKTKNVDVDREAERFVNHWQANGTTRKDWSATWRNWIMKAEEMTPRNITAIKPKPKPGLYDEAYGF